MTECTEKRLGFHGLGRRDVVGRFDGGMITSDAGGMLLRELEDQTGILERFAGCFTDYRDPVRVEHSVEELIKQRVYGLALGYEDLNDHDQLRTDSLLGVLVGKTDPCGADRRADRDQGKALAGKSTLNRLELTPVGANTRSRYKKIVASCRALQKFFVDIFLDSYSAPPSEMLILDVDATDDRVHGNQLGRFFHGYYKSYCFLPLYIFCGEHLLCSKLRPSNIDASQGTAEELKGIVARIRERWPTIRILVRGDSGFCRESLMQWCEDNHVDYVLGLAQNERLKAEIASEMQQAKQQRDETGIAARVFKDFLYQTLKSWHRPRRVIGKAECLVRGENPRFVVTSLSAAEFDAAALYEETYCGRGEMENRIKEQQLSLFADRTSCETMRANQLRLWLSSVTYTLMVALRQFGLAETELEKAQCETIRRKLLKVGAQVRVTCRKVWISLASCYPYQSLFIRIYLNIRMIKPIPLLG